MAAKRRPSARGVTKPPGRAKTTAAPVIPPEIKRRKRHLIAMPRVEGIEETAPVPLLAAARYFSCSREAMHRTIQHFGIKMMGRPRGIGGHGGTDWLIPQSEFRRLVSCLEGSEGRAS